MKSLITGWGLLLALTAAGAQTAVHRCGNSYSQAPCPQSTVIDVADPRSAAQQAGAERVNDDQRRLAAQMHRERVAEERARRPTSAANLGGTPSDARPVAAGRVSAGAYNRRSKARDLSTERILVPSDSTTPGTSSDSPTRKGRTAP